MNKVEYKCEECDFYGKDDLALEVHYRKTHSDPLELEQHKSILPEYFTLNKTEKIRKSSAMSFT